MNSKMFSHIPVIGVLIPLKQITAEVTLLDRMRKNATSSLVIVPIKQIKMPLLILVVGSLLAFG